ncbi:MAG: type IX secretion system sortase PorU [Bacteroidales bacterium]|nr:type IX secretion system sortase PorU [Candidatus Sodaliphilus aphodohippi]
MNKLSKIYRLALTTLLCCAATLSAYAYSQSQYVSQSKLATGKWVKISIPTDGIYELTDQELKDMGFTDPSKVQVFGCGGHMMSEILKPGMEDDLQQVSTMRINGKLCFYAMGPVAMTLAGPKDTPAFTRTINAYSTHGYYFLTEGGSDQAVQTIPSLSADNYTPLTTGLDYCYHEKELRTVSFTGKDMLGEDLTSNDTFDVYLPGVAGNSITLNTTVAGQMGGDEILRGTFTCAGGSKIVIPFQQGDTIKMPGSNSTAFYYTCNPIQNFTAKNVGENNTLTLTFSYPVKVKQAYLDNFIVTYTRNNTIGENSQTRLANDKLNSTDLIILPGANASTRLWEITDNNDPVDCELKTSADGPGHCAGASTKSRYFVAFDPTGTLMKISGYEAIANQDLHNMETPDMLIVTNKTFMPQAERLAQLHRQYEMLNVAVVDQEQIFNEFSSGTPDAMAVRLFCKMLYDRNQTKFRNLLMFGQGCQDNRRIVNDKGDIVITYQSDTSNDEATSFTSDDFFGFLDDNSGLNHDKDVLRLGVGRITCSSPSEAEADVDKIAKYILAPDYGHWRNSQLIVGDSGDENIHAVQAEGICNLIKGTVNNQMELNKVFVDMYPRAVDEQHIENIESRTPTEARRAIMSNLHDGLYFFDYIGHAGPTMLTKKGMWTTTEAKAMANKQLPIGVFATCDVARYDSNTRGIAERMFHMNDGGFIAMLASTRMVYADNNNLLNQAWIKNMFNWKTSGRMPTLGEVYMNTKQTFGSVSNHNKLNFMLLGDPAIKVNYPKPLFKITSVNGTDVTNDAVVSTGPTQTISFTAKVMKSNGKDVDTNFNGDATLTIYEAEKKFTTMTNRSTKRDIYYPREVIARVQGRVNNGIFGGKLVMPRYCTSINSDGMIRVYAHRDNSSEMVNGQYDKLQIAKFNQTQGTTDDQPPVIKSMYINDEKTFNEGDVVPAGSTLYISMADSSGINTQTMSIGNSIRLLLDNGKQTFDNANNYLTLSDMNRQGMLAMPLTGIAPGLHNMSVTVHDVFGNATSKAISFVIGTGTTGKVSVEELPAIDQATISVTGLPDDIAPTCNIKVTDALGNLVWSTSATTFPVVWNLTTTDGKRVAGGLYKVFGNYSDGTVTGGTDIGEIIVLDKIKN